MGTFDFTVSSMTVKNPRSWLTDSDYATLAISALAADNTIVKQYGPITASLGDIGKGLSINPNMSLTGLAVPDGGSLAVSFIVVNKGAWNWDSYAINAMELAGTAVLGALVQGSIVSSTAVVAGTTSSPVILPVALALSAYIIGYLEALNIILAHCDGTVVPGAMTIGQKELLSSASPGPWKFSFEYPGTDSSDGCGANSDYSVTYSVETTPSQVPVPKVAVPDLIGMSSENATRRLSAVGLIGVEGIIPSADNPPATIVSQSPVAGTQVAVHSEVHYYIKKKAPIVSGPPGKPHEPGPPRA